MCDGYCSTWIYECIILDLGGFFCAQCELCRKQWTANVYPRRISIFLYRCLMVWHFVVFCIFLLILRSYRNLWKLQLLAFELLAFVSRLDGERSESFGMSRSSIVICGRGVSYFYCFLEETKSARGKYWWMKYVCDRKAISFLFQCWIVFVYCIQLTRVEECRPSRSS